VVSQMAVLASGGVKLLVHSDAGNCYQKLTNNKGSRIHAAFVQPNALAALCNGRERAQDATQLPGILMLSAANNAWRRTRDTDAQPENAGCTLSELTASTAHANVTSAAVCRGVKL
jgi:hypothetical protein